MPGIFYFESVVGEHTRFAVTVTSVKPVTWIRDIFNIQTTKCFNKDIVLRDVIVAFAIFLLTKSNPVFALIETVLQRTESLKTVVISVQRM